MLRYILLLLYLYVCLTSGQEYPQGHNVSFYFWTCSLNGRLQDGTCCDNKTSTNCPAHCDVHFFVCIREHNETSNYCNENTTSHFTYFHYAYLDVYNITFFERDNVFGEGLHNPLVYSFSGNWSKRIQTVLVARDFDIHFSVPYYRFEYIDYIDVNWTVPAGRAVDRRSYDGVFRNMVVQVGLKVDCWKGWFGDYCITSCVARDNVTGHYLCDRSGEKECLHGWGGVHCTTGICDPVCPMGASCSNTTRECSCDHGYREVGELCECVLHAKCNPIGSYCQVPGDECTCRKGFKGSYCNNVDYCEYRGNPCHNGGTCVSTENNTYSCECATGFQGAQCDFMACPNTGCAASLPCGNNGMCANTSSGVHCMCDTGFVGRCCQTLINFCLSNPCAYGSCTNMIGDYSCSCDTGYTGKNCHIPTDECSVHEPCENEGTCYDRIGGYSCLCASGFSGVNCSENCTGTLCDCADSCVYGDCLSDGMSYFCQCLPGYSGRSCDSNIDDCLGACLNGANCTDGVNRFVCHCPGGYKGDTCGTDIDECLSDPCEHGSCSNSVGSYACNCEAAYTGESCDTFQQLDYCTTHNPCLNGGICHNEAFGTRCECLSGFNGTECEEELDPCEGILCSNGGVCEEGQCVCPVSYTGPVCTQSVDVCEEYVEPADCNGLCVNDANDTSGYRCECLPGYTGETCHTDIYDCYAGACQNGGNCTDGLNEFFCDCERGYTGERCEDPVNPCESNLCLNGGVCVSEGSGFRCECPEGYVVPICEKVEDCNRRSCNDKGECKGISKGVSEALCHCDLGYTGQFCETLIDYCASAPCHNGATCYKGVGSYYCRCENNITGCVESGEPSGNQLIPGIDNSLTGVGGGVALGVILTLLVVLVFVLLLYALRYRGRKGVRRREETPRGRGQRNQLLDSQDSTFINPFFDGTEVYPVFEPPSYDTIQYSHYKVQPALYPAVLVELTTLEKKDKEVYANPSILEPQDKVPL